MTIKPVKLILLAFVGFIFVLVPACVPEEPIDGEEEIDTVRLTIDGTTVEWNVDDTADPVIQLAANSEFSVSVEFWNEYDGTNVTDEIQQENTQHLVCYDVMSANLTVEATDSDGTYPVGLETKFTTGDASTGTLVLELRHQPGVKDGTCTPGDSDVQVSFDIEIQ